VRDGHISRPAFVANLLFLWILPAVLSEVITGRWGPQDDEDDDETLARQIGTVAAYPLAAVVGIRDAVNATISGYGYELTPVTDALDRTVSLTQSVAEGDLDRQTAKTAALALGYWFALPARQVWLTGEYTYDWLSGETDGFDPWQALVRRPPQ
jgi:hypothetical protein